MRTDRAFARVETSLPLRLRPLGADEAADLASRLQREASYREEVAPVDLPSGGETDGNWERAALRTVIDRLDRLERMVRALGSAVGADLDFDSEWIEGETVAFSGSGVGAFVATLLPEGQLVEVELSLVGSTTAKVRALGRIASIVRPDGEAYPVGRFHLGVAFEAIHEADREAVIRYTFRVQRAQLRERKDDENT